MLYFITSFSIELVLSTAMSFKCHIAFVVAATIAVHASPPEGYNLVWSDEFDGDQLNSSKWFIEVNCDGGGNGEAQCYTSRSENIRVSDGVLTIQARPESYLSRDYTSGRIRGSESGWTYGYFETKIRLPKGPFIWPAAWMMPTENKYGIWPDSGEIDIMEHRGQESDRTEGTIHCKGWADGSGMKTFPGITDFSHDYHIFGFEWTSETMKWFVDGRQFHETNIDRVLSGRYNKKGSPFDEKFNWILNVAVWGAYFPVNRYGVLTIEMAKKWEKPVMEIDFVRVYQKGNNMIDQGNTSQNTYHHIPCDETCSNNGQVDICCRSHYVFAGGNCNDGKALCTLRGFKPFATRHHITPCDINCK